MSTYDVAVIGAGPSGSRTARLLAERGHRVVLIEKDAQPGLPVHCTGIVSAECMEKYALPSSLVLHAVRAFTLRSPKGSPANLRRNSNQAYVLDRVALDQHLAADAQCAGAELLTSTSVFSIERADGLMRLSAHTPDGERTITAKIAVLATGFGSPLSRHFGFTNQGGLLSGCQAVVKAPDVMQVEVFTGRQFGQGGFGWLVPYKPGLALGGLLTRVHTVRLMEEHIARLRAAGRIGETLEVFRCRPIPLAMPDSTIADGILAVGDAVGQVKPTTGGGIYFGMLSADIAAQAIHGALLAGDYSAAALQQYEDGWRQLLSSEIRLGYTLRRLGEQIPDGGIEQLHTLLRIPPLRRILVSARPSFDWHSSPLLRVLQRFQQHA